MVRVGLLGVALLGAGWAIAVGAGGSAAGRVASGRIAYFDPSPWWSLYTMKPDGSDRRRLTINGGVWPAWSPDGTKIAVTRNAVVYVVDTRSFQLRKITRGAGAQWLPDSRRLIVGRWTSYAIVDSLKPSRRQPLRLPSSAGGAVWSPRGGVIAFSVDSHSIALADHNGSNVREITTRAPHTHFDSPAWSPDGAQIAFARCVEDPDAPAYEEEIGEVIVADADGANQHAVFHYRGDCASALSWSPRGKMIAFYKPGPHFHSPRLPEEPTGTQVINADGSNPRLIDAGWGNYGLTWTR